VLQPIYSISTNSVAAAILGAAGSGGLNYTNTGGAVNIRGFAGAVHGQLFGFVNAGANNLTILHMDATVPDLAARVYCPGAVNLLRTPAQLAVLWWNDALGYWLVVAAPSCFGSEVGSCTAPLFKVRKRFW
jgi:hypothetical protein